MPARAAPRNVATSWGGEEESSLGALGVVVDVVRYVTIHVGMLAALAATMHYKRVNACTPAQTRELLRQKPVLLMVVPHALFLVGTCGFILTVIATGAASAQSRLGLQLTYCAVGACCPIAMVVGFWLMVPRSS